MSSEIRRSIAETYFLTHGIEYPHLPRKTFTDDEDLVLWEMVERRRNELGMAPPWFMDELKRLERAASDFLEEHGEPAYPEEEWDDEDDLPSYWRRER